MKRVGVMALVALVCSVVFGVFGGGQQVIADDHSGCDGLAEYQERVQDMVPDELAEYMRFVAVADGFGVTELAPSEQREFVELYDAWAIDMKEMDEQSIPVAARPYHEAWTDVTTAMANMNRVLADGNMFGVGLYLDVVDEARDRLDDAKAHGYEMCGEEWSDIFGVPADESDEDSGSRTRDER